MPPEVAAVIRNARLRLGWSQTTAAYWCGVSRRHYQYLEAGERRPSDRTAERLVDGLGLKGQAVRAIRAAAVPGWHTRHGYPLVRASGRGNRRPSGRKPTVSHHGSCIEHLAKQRFPWAV
jgi:DNA-binding XRE family transcriptional regulator